MIPKFGPEQVEEWCYYFYEMEKMKEEQCRAEVQQFSFGLVEIPTDIPLEILYSLLDI